MQEESRSPTELRSPTLGVHLPEAISQFLPVILRIFFQ